MYFTQRSHGPLLGSGETAGGITGPLHRAFYGGDFYGMKAAGACVDGCRCITVSSWQSGL